MNIPPIVSSTEWQAARDALLAKEKDATRARDALAAERRRLPVVRIEKDYVFDGPDGKARLHDLFEGRRQLLVYHFMFGQTRRQAATGARCSSTRSATLLTCTPAARPLRSCPERRSRRSRRTGSAWAGRSRGCRRSRATSTSTSVSRRRRPEPDVYQDGETFGLSVFLRDGDSVFRSYFTTHRGVEALGSVWTFLDLTPLGRQEDWEDSPAGYPQTKPYEWWRRHDEYEDVQPEPAA